MTDDTIHAASAEFCAKANISTAEYERLYQESVEQPEAFWRKIAERVDWIRFPTKIKDTSFAPDDVHIRWFEDGQLNLSVNCLDRHLATRGDK
ncbi:MAG: acetyl-coenzyme A synthetase, partial [Xanthomonadales bacterium]|nr:acetyl-coenzyme A synthetase [Xanthomonadales bacterium]